MTPSRASYALEFYFVTASIINRLLVYSVQQNGIAQSLSTIRACLLFSFYFASINSTENVLSN